jgi:hypothetical protein
MKTHIRRTALTIEFEQVYRGSRKRAFLPCEECERENARLSLADAIWLLRGVLAHIESWATNESESEVCLFCLCGRALEIEKEKEL